MAARIFHSNPSVSKLIEVSVLSQVKLIYFYQETLPNPSTITISQVVLARRDRYVWSGTSSLLNFLVFLLTHKWEKQAIRVYLNLAYQEPLGSSAEALIQLISPKFSLSWILILHTFFSIYDTNNKSSACQESWFFFIFTYSRHYLKINIKDQPPSWS